MDFVAEFFVLKKGQIVGVSPLVVIYLNKKFAKNRQFALDTTL